MKTQTFWAFRSRNYSLLLPVVARMTLNGNASTYGYLNSFTGIGAIAVAIFLATVTPQLNLGKVLVIILQRYITKKFHVQLRKSTNSKSSDAEQKTSWIAEEKVLVYI